MAKQMEIKEQAEKAFIALKNYSLKSNKKLLFPEAEGEVLLLISYKKVIFHQSKHRKLIQLPHVSKNSTNTSMCLILPDLDTSKEAKCDADVDGQARQWYEILRKKYSLTGADIAKIFTYTQLTREYSQPPEKTKLANTYDIFLIDAKLMKKAISFLGKKFMASGNVPIPFHSDKNNLPLELERAYSTVNLSLEALKDNASVYIGNLFQSTKDLTENLLAVLENLFKSCPGGEHNIRSLHIKAKNIDASLPIYIDFGSANEVKLPKTRSAKDRKNNKVIDGCSTLPEGLLVKVHRNGKVYVVDDKSKKNVKYPTINDEWEKRDDIKPFDASRKRLRVKIKKEENSTKKKKSKFTKKKNAVKAK